MGLGDADGGGGGGKSSAVAVTVTCSICLDAVTDNGDRSWAELQCGHKFHLDCIGSAFNIKGAMQCPNCRKIEKGQWLYSNGNRSVPEFNMDDWTQDEDLYDLSFPEMSFGVHWCPISGLSRLPTSFEEGEFQTSAYHDFIGHHAIFAAEHTPVSSTTHPCPYIAYVGPIHPSSSASSGNMSDGSAFSGQWNGPSVTSEVASSFGFPSMDVHYHLWDHAPYAASSRMSGADQPLVPPVTQRTSRNNYDIQRSRMHPFVVGHSSANRAPSSGTSSVVPPYPGPVARPRDRPPALQAYFQQSSSGAPGPISRASLVSTQRRASNHRGLAQVAPMASSADQSGGFYFFSSGSSGRVFQEAENPVREHFHSWERERQPTFPSSLVDRDSIWGPFHLPARGSDAGFRYRQRHGSERMPSQNWS